MQPTKYYDRHMPLIDRSSMINFHQPSNQPTPRNNYSHKEINKKFYDNRLYEICSNSQHPQGGSSILKFQRSNQLPTEIFKENAYNEQKENERQLSLNRNYNIPCDPYKIIEFPDVQKNDNSNVLHVSEKGEIAIGVDDTVHLFSNFSVNERTDIHTLNDIQQISCVHWMPGSNIIFTGDEHGAISLLDAESGDELTQCQYSLGKVSCASSPSQDSSSVYFGTTDGLVEKIDIRQERAELLNHCDPISAMAISSDNLQLALGTSTGDLKVFDLRTGTHSLTTRCHQSSIKALSWAPWEKNTVFVGGGVIDPTLKAINVLQQKTVAEDRSINCAITAIHSCYQKGKLVTCHGNAQASSFDNEGSSVVWDYSHNAFTPLAQLKGEKPVSFSSLNPDRTALLTLNEDEKLRLWQVEKPKQVATKPKPSTLHNGIFRTLR